MIGEFVPLQAAIELSDCGVDCVALWTPCMVRDREAMKIYDCSDSILPISIADNGIASPPCITTLHLQEKSYEQASSLDIDLGLISVYTRATNSEVHNAAMYKTSHHQQA